jgi:hypothetical protein
LIAHLVAEYIFNDFAEAIAASRISAAQERSWCKEKKVTGGGYLIFTPPSLAASRTKVLHPFALIAVIRKPILRSLER